MFVVGTIYSYNYFVIRAHLQYVGKYSDGKLPLWIKEPHFVADPTHRVKVVAKQFFAIFCYFQSPSGSIQCQQGHVQGPQE